MQLAGVSTDYRGLYQTVAEFSPPSSFVIDQYDWRAEDDESRTALTRRMAALGRHWDSLKNYREAGFPDADSHPDLRPQFEAERILLAFQDFMNGPELLVSGYVADLTLSPKSFSSAVRRTQTLSRLLEQYRDGGTKAKKRKLDAAFESVRKACKKCHVKYRDN